MTEDSNLRPTLYVGNLGSEVTEGIICTLFGTIGPVKGCKIIRDSGSDPYAFVEYHNHQAASTAIAAMNKRSFLNKEMKVNWATSSAGNQPKIDISSHYHIFVGDLSPEIETETLKEAFAPFGEISNCRIVRDQQTQKSKGYAFVSFVKKIEAENAIQSMNGQWLGSRTIRTNWSTRKPPPPRESKGIPGKNADYEEIYNQTSPTNTTVYCGGFPQNLITDDIIHKHFGQFGPIQDIRVFKDKGYAFIKFQKKDSAAHAIEGTNNSDVYGHPVKCSWGKENGGDLTTTMMATMNNSNSIHNIQGAGIIIPPHTPVNNHNHQLQQPQQPQQPGAQYSYGYQYWYPSYPAQIAQAQYIQQGYAAYPYPYASPQQQNAGYRMMQPAAANVTWGMPTAIPSVANGTNSYANGAAAAVAGATQPMVYPMPQFQTQ